MKGWLSKVVSLILVQFVISLCRGIHFFVFLSKKQNVLLLLLLLFYYNTFSILFFSLCVSMCLWSIYTLSNSSIFFGNMVCCVSCFVIYLCHVWQQQCCEDANLNLKLCEKLRDKMMCHLHKPADYSRVANKSFH